MPRHRWLTFSYRPFFVVATGVTIVSALAVLGWLFVNRPLYVDAHGQVHGTGLRRYFYRNGALKLEEQYRMGELVLSQWFNPDGQPVATTHWKKGNGTAIELDEEGRIRKRLPMQAGFAEGWADYYGVSGTIVKRVRFVGGVKVEERIVK